MEQLETLKNEDSVTQSQKNLLEPKRSPLGLLALNGYLLLTAETEKTKKQHPSFVVVGWKTIYSLNVECLCRKDAEANRY